MREQAELRGYIVSGIVDELASLKVEDVVGAKSSKVKRKMSDPTVRGNKVEFVGSKSAGAASTGKSSTEQEKIGDSKAHINTGEGIDIAPRVPLDGDV